MKFLPALALTVAALRPAIALAADTAAPTSLGTFGDWTAATYGAGAKKACYAFTKAQASSEIIPNRGDVLLVVTERKSGHDEVTLSAGYTYPAKPTVTLDIGGPKITFYTQGATAFTTAGTTAITAFQQGSSATAKSSAPGGDTVTDTFSLAGFSDAYSAITAACP
jgi:invasion protein IalB